jgi:phosphate/sulfate permease
MSAIVATAKVSGTPFSQILAHIQDGRFQRSLSFITAGSSFISGLEVAYEHYRGSYSNPVMYSPVLLSFALSGAGVWGTFNERAARTVLRALSLVTLLDGVVGFGFHVRGIQRKPGGWRLPITNIIMGPPIFAPLLFGTAAYLGFMASYLRREEDLPQASQQVRGWRLQLRHGQFQKHLALVSGMWALFSGFESWYSHYKSNFRSWSQWTPVLLAPVQVGACIAAVCNQRAARTLLPASSALAALDGAIGFGYHVRGVLRRPGGRKNWLYNILYGPPVFAPLLFAACGALGLLASLLRRERK